MNTARWPQVRLGDVLTKKSDWIDLDPDTDYRQVTVKMWGEGVTLRRVVKGSGIAASSQVKVHARQFIVSKIDARHGASGIVPIALDGAVVSQDFPVFEAHENRLLPEFLGWLSKTDWFVGLCRAASEGSTNRVRLREDRFLNHTIPLPPLPDQHRLLQSLDTVAGGIEARTQKVRAVEAELVAALIRGFQKITAGAPRVRLNELAPLVRREANIDPDAVYPELGIRSFGKGTFHKPSVNGLDVGTRTLYRIESGDLLFNITFAWEGAVAVATENDGGRYASHRFLSLVVDKNRTTAAFLRYYFLSQEGLQRLVSSSPGSAGRNRVLSVKKLMDMELPLPSLEAQQWFDELQAKAAAARAHSAEAAAEMGHLIPAMLNQVF